MPNILGAVEYFTSLTEDMISNSKPSSQFSLQDWQGNSVTIILIG